MPRADACVTVRLVPVFVVTVVHSNCTRSGCPEGELSITVTSEDWPANTGGVSAVGTGVQEVEVGGACNPEVSVAVTVMKKVVRSDVS